MLIFMFLWPDNSFKLALLWVPTQETQIRVIRWSGPKLKKMVEEQQLGDYNLPQMSTSSKEQKFWTLYNWQPPKLGHKKV